MKTIDGYFSVEYNEIIKNKAILRMEENNEE